MKHVLEKFLENQINHSIKNHNIIRTAIDEGLKKELKSQRTRKSGYKYEEITDHISIDLDAFLVSYEDFKIIFNKIRNQNSDRSIIISELMEGKSSWHEARELYIPRTIPGLVGNRKIYISSTNQTYEKRNEISSCVTIAVFEDDCFATAWEIIK